MRLTFRLSERNGYCTPIPSSVRASWCQIKFALPRQDFPIVCRIETVNDGAAAPGEPIFPGGGISYVRSLSREAVVFIPKSASGLRLDVFGASRLPATLAVTIRSLSRRSAAVRIGLRHPMRVLAAMRGDRAGAGGRLRAMLAVLATGDAPCSYPLWIRVFDTWSSDDLARLNASPRRAAWPAITAFVCGPAATDAGPAHRPGGLRDTLASLAAQLFPVVGTSVAGQQPTSGTDAAYVAVLQAGEVLPPHALAVLADEIVRLGHPDAVYADEDCQTPDGTRATPHFKPQPNHALMLSGTLTRGVWLVRRELFSALDVPSGRHWAEALRLSLWLRLYASNGAGATYRIPFVLTHRRPDTDAAPPEVLADVVRGHLANVMPAARVEPSFPLTVHTAPRSPADSVTIVVPSACRAPHVLRCLHAVLTRTQYANFNLLLVLSQPEAPDAQQQATLEQLTVDPRVRWQLHTAASFNYAAANNHAAALANGTLLCLLNDDVEPTHGGWLGRMVGHLDDPRVGIVGAKLCYPNGLVQHGGMVMGMAGLAEHANRFRSCNDTGYAWRNVLDQEVCAVTGACMLIRRALYQTVGGMDESYAATFNDVDLCLRVREAGHAVVLSARTTLIHYESLSFGKHASAAAAERQARDADRMRARWRTVLADDPFHNPNLSLQRGNEAGLAFPPRVARPPIRDAAEDA